MKYRLLCFDLDGVIFKQENHWFSLHKKYGTLSEGAELTKKYLKKDYDSLVKEVVGRLWKGKDAKEYYKMAKSLRYAKGVKKLFMFLKQKKVKTAIISASSLEAANRAQKELGVDFVFANKLVIKNGKITGEFVSTVGTGYKKKAEILRKLCRELKIKLSETVYVGDSDNDIDAFRTAGLPIAFNTKSKELKKLAKKTVKNHAELLKILKNNIDTDK